ncbi:hypothetical protein [Tsukamurella columbiensis]|uniref:Uncharacterized protein n=1 Tax=Tsukamurella columbiensis TaxID=128509 RepID=A0ABX1LM47_9ACTN|nr:hypothetical protein [Tsukamurella columbiensis]NMD58028.1 hypothetical protein [Tsukamurella columbiensis]
MNKTAAELHDEVVDLLDALQGARRRLTEIKHEFAGLDPDQLDVDEIGDTTTARGTLQAARDGLGDVDRAVALAQDAVYAAMRHTSRLRNV